MKALVLSFTFVAFSICSMAQELKKRKELALSFPFAVFTGDYSVQYEQYLSSKRSLSISAGYKMSDVFSYLANTIQYKGARVSFGDRFYKELEDNWMNIFWEGKMNLDYGKLKLNDPLGDIDMDSLSVKGFSISPELNVGFKATILKNISMTFSVGARYIFNTFKTDKLSFNPKHWPYNGWDENTSDPLMRRANEINSKKGLRPSANFTIGYVF